MRKEIAEKIANEIDCDLDRIQRRLFGLADRCQPKMSEWRDAAYAITNVRGAVRCLMSNKARMETAG